MPRTAGQGHPLRPGRVGSPVIGHDEAMGLCSLREGNGEIWHFRLFEEGEN